MKFAANLGFLFVKEAPKIVDRYQLARLAGFSAVEVPFPYEIPLEDLVSAKAAADIQQVLINAYPGDLKKGELGISIYSERRYEFRESLELSIRYLKALDCTRLHIMAGKVTPATDMAEAEKVYVDNIRYAAGRLEKEGVLALIEPCNNQWIPDYFMNHPQKALHIIKEVDHPNLKLQLDIFHAQIIQGDLTRCIKECMPYVGHVQIAQVPNRGEPDSSGEICYEYVLKLLSDLGYDGWIGLEYIPSGITTVGGLQFLNTWK